VTIRSSRARDSSAIADLEARAAHTDGINKGITVEYSQNHRVAVVELPIEGKGNDAKSYAALANIREDLVPATVGKLKNAEVVVGGNAAQSKDCKDLVKGSAPIVLAFVLTLAFLLHMVTFRSIVVPIKAIVLNLLSVAASYGVPTLVVQHGRLRAVDGLPRLHPQPGPRGLRARGRGRSGHRLAPSIHPRPQPRRAVVRCQAGPFERSSSFAASVLPSAETPSAAAPPAPRAGPRRRRAGRAR
jgi:hypothetical protein